MTRKEIYIFGIVFLISVLIRIPNLNRPLSKHHEFNAAFFLIPMEIWNESSGFDYNFNPVLNYSNSGDKGINNFSAGDTKFENRFYYLSFGAGSYIFPYAFMQLMGGPSVINLQLFSILVHLLTAIVLILITKTIFKSLKIKENYALISGLIYLLLPHTLWFHGNGYTHHSLVVLFFLLTNWSLLKYLEKPDKLMVGILYSIFLFLTIYTEWVGCFLSFSALLFVFKYSRKDFFKLFLLTIVTSSLAILFIYWQSSAIIGKEKYIDYLLNRFWDRSDLGSSSTGYLYFIKRISFWFTIGYLPIILWIIFGIIKLRSISVFKPLLKFSILILVPIGLHHIVFSGFTAAHDYSVLIDASYLAILGAFICYKLNVFSYRIIKQLVFGFSFIFLSCLIYYGINRPGEISQRGDRYDAFQKIGQTIQNHSSSDDIIFIEGLEDLPNPQVVYYAKRNFYAIKSKSEMASILKRRNCSKALYLKVVNYQVVYWECLR
jgi:hypothetical protein